jgi:hypothetical protein
VPAGAWLEFWATLDVIGRDRWPATRCRLASRTRYESRPACWIRDTIPHGLPWPQGRARADRSAALVQDHHFTIDPTWRNHQHVLNQSWPPGSRRIRDQPQRIPVWVRMVWAIDGEQWMHGHASRWTPRHVFVELGDARLATLGVWVRPGEVRRR